MELTTRPISEDEAEAFWHTLSMGFGSDPKDEDRESFFRVAEPGRTVAAFDGVDIVGTAGAWSLEVTVPGGVIPMGGTTVVAVLPSHRRQGVLRAMMGDHLEDVASNGEPIAGLWASEASIYGRFGFGYAADRMEIELDGSRIDLRDGPPGGRVRLIGEDEARKAFPPVYELVRTARPGMLGRTEAWWDGRFEDPEHWRRGKSKRRYAIYETSEATEGYVAYRQKEEWEDFPQGMVDVVELICATDHAHAGLWHFLTNIDLYPRVKYWNLAVDDPLPWKVTESRRVVRKISDALWIRLVDIPAALKGRAYDMSGRLRIGVTDSFRPANDGVYELVAEAGAVTCQIVEASPDIELDADALGALYLGAGHAPALARAGRISGSEGAVRDLHRMFRWDPPPWCPEVF